MIVPWWLCLCWSLVHTMYYCRSPITCVQALVHKVWCLLLVLLLGVDAICVCVSIAFFLCCPLAGSLPSSMCWPRVQPRLKTSPSAQLTPMKMSLCTMHELCYALHTRCLVLLDVLNLNSNLILISCAGNQSNAVICRASWPTVVAMGVGGCIAHMYYLG